MRHSNVIASFGGTFSIHKSCFYFIFLVLIVMFDFE